ncbi:MAG: hypothetical protein ACKVJ2_15040, partial [Pseudomonadales bacterium]
MLANVIKRIKTRRFVFGMLLSVFLVALLLSNHFNAPVNAPIVDYPSTPALSVDFQEQAVGNLSAERLASQVSKYKVNGKKAVEPDEVLAKSGSLIRALDPNSESKNESKRSPKQDLLDELLLETDSVDDVRQVLTEAGGLKAIYGDISFDISYSDDLANQKTILKDLVLAHGSLFGLEAAGTIESITIHCVVEMCTAKVEKAFSGIIAPSHSLSFSYKDGSIFAILGKFDGPKLSLAELPNALTRNEISKVTAQHFGVMEEEIRLPEKPGIRSIESRGGIDFFGERWHNLWINDTPYLVILNTATRQVVAVESLIREVQVQASGDDLYGKAQGFNAEEVSGAYQMVDKSFPVNYETTVWDFDGYKAKELYDIFNEGGVTSDEVISSNQRDSGWDPAAVSLLV